MQKKDKKPFYSVKLIFQENWEGYLKHILQEKLRKKKWKRCFLVKTKAEADFGIIDKTDDCSTVLSVFSNG